MRTFKRLLALFLIARLGLVRITVADPSGAVLTDSKGYLGLARGLIRNGRYGVQPDGEADLLRPPAYSGFLALVQLALGPQTYLITLLQLAMSGWTSWLLVALGRELEAPGAGLVAGWLYALSPNVALWSLTVMTEVPFALMLVLITFSVVKAVKASHRRWPVAAGGALGLLAYLRPIAIPLMPVWAAAAYGIERRTVGPRRALTGALALILAGALLVLPWVYRNGAAYGKVTFSTATTKTLVGFNLAEVVAQAEGTNRNRAVSSLDPSKGLIRLTAEVLGRYPVVFVKAQVLGVARSLAGTDIGTWGNVFGEDDWVGLGLLSGAFWGSLGRAHAAVGEPADPSFWMRMSILGGSVLFSGLLIALAGLGIAMRRSRRRAETAFRALALTSVAVLLLIPGAAGQARFRVPAEPYLALLAGYGALGLARWIQASRRRRQAVAGPRAAPAAGSNERIAPVIDWHAGALPTPPLRCDRRVSG